MYDRSRRIAVLVLSLFAATAGAQDERPRARDVGLVVGTFPTGELNAITDVDGVRVGHATVIEGEDIRTGVTAIIPGPGNLYTHPMPAWIHVGNGYGKLIGETQVREFGELETPILLTCTLCVWSAANALKEWVYEQPGMGEHTVNPIVGETNDFRSQQHVKGQSDWARSGFCRIGRRLPTGRSKRAASAPAPAPRPSAGKAASAPARASCRSRSVAIPIGVLVQTNYGGTFWTINGAPVGRELGNYANLPDDLELEAEASAPNSEDGSIMMVVATDAPLTARNLDRIAMRAMMGLARTGSYASNGSGDYVIAFSTDPVIAPPAARAMRRSSASRARQCLDVPAVRGDRRGNRGGDLQRDLQGDHRRPVREARSRLSRSRTSCACSRKHQVH